MAVEAQQKKVEEKQGIPTVADRVDEAIRRSTGKGNIREILTAREELENLVKAGALFSVSAEKRLEIDRAIQKADLTWNQHRVASVVEAARLVDKASADTNSPEFKKRDQYRDEILHSANEAKTAKEATLAVLTSKHPIPTSYTRWESKNEQQLAKGDDATQLSGVRRDEKLSSGFSLGAFKDYKGQLTHSDAIVGQGPGAVETLAQNTIYSAAMYLRHQSVNTHSSLGGTSEERKEFKLRQSGAAQNVLIGLLDESNWVAVNSPAVAEGVKRIQTKMERDLDSVDASNLKPGEIQIAKAKLGLKFANDLTSYLTGQVKAENLQLSKSGYQALRHLREIQAGEDLRRMDGNELLELVGKTAASLPLLALGGGLAGAAGGYATAAMLGDAVVVSRGAMLFARAMGTVTASGVFTGGEAAVRKYAFHDAQAFDNLLQKFGTNTALFAFVGLADAAVKGVAIARAVKPLTNGKTGEELKELKVLLDQPQVRTAVFERAKETNPTFAKVVKSAGFSAEVSAFAMGSLIIDVAAGKKSPSVLVNPKELAEAFGHAALMVTALHGVAPRSSLKGGVKLGLEKPATLTTEQFSAVAQTKPQNTDSAAPTVSTAEAKPEPRTETPPGSSSVRFEVVMPDAPQFTQGPWGLRPVLGSTANQKGQMSAPGGGGTGARGRSPLNAPVRPELRFEIPPTRAEFREDMKALDEKLKEVEADPSVSERKYQEITKLTNELVSDFNKFGFRTEQRQVDGKVENVQVETLDGTFLRPGVEELVQRTEDFKNDYVEALRAEKNKLKKARENPDLTPERKSEALESIMNIDERIELVKDSTRPLTTPNVSFRFKELELNSTSNKLEPKIAVDKLPEQVDLDIATLNRTALEKKDSIGVEASLPAVKRTYEECYRGALEIELALKQRRDEKLDAIDGIDNVATHKKLTEAIEKAEAEVTKARQRLLEFETTQVENRVDQKLARELSDPSLSATRGEEIFGEQIRERNEVVAYLKRTEQMSDLTPAAAKGRDGSERTLGEPRDIVLSREILQKRLENAERRVADSAKKYERLSEQENQRVTSELTTSLEQPDLTSVEVEKIFSEQLLNRNALNLEVATTGTDSTTATSSARITIEKDTVGVVTARTVSEQRLSEAEERITLVVNKYKDVAKAERSKANKDLEASLEDPNLTEAEVDSIFRKQIEQREAIKDKLDAANKLTAGRDPKALGAEPIDLIQNDPVGLAVSRDVLREQLKEAETRVATASKKYTETFSGRDKIVEEELTLRLRAPDMGISAARLEFESQLALRDTALNNVERAKQQAVGQTQGVQNDAVGLKASREALDKRLEFSERMLAKAADKYADVVVQHNTRQAEILSNPDGNLTSTQRATLLEFNLNQSRRISQSIRNGRVQSKDASGKKSPKNPAERVTESEGALITEIYHARLDELAAFTAVPTDFYPPRPQDAQRANIPRINNGVPPAAVQRAGEDFVVSPQRKAANLGLRLDVLPEIPVNLPLGAAEIRLQRREERAARVEAVDSVNRVVASVGRGNLTRSGEAAAGNSQKVVDGLTPEGGSYNYTEHRENTDRRKALHRHAIAVRDAAQVTVDRLDSDQNLAARPELKDAKTGRKSVNERIQELNSLVSTLDPNPATQNKADRRTEDSKGGTVPGIAALPVGGAARTSSVVWQMAKTSGLSAGSLIPLGSPLYLYLFVKGDLQQRGESSKVTAILQKDSAAFAKQIQAFFTTATEIEGKSEGLESARQTLSAAISKLDGERSKNGIINQQVEGELRLQERFASYIRKLSENVSADVKPQIVLTMTVTDGVNFKKGVSVRLAEAETLQSKGYLILNISEVRLSAEKTEELPARERNYDDSQVQQARNVLEEAVAISSIESTKKDGAESQPILDLLSDRKSEVVKTIRGLVRRMDRTRVDLIAAEAVTSQAWLNGGGNVSDLRESVAEIDAFTPHLIALTALTNGATLPSSMTPIEESSLTTVSRVYILKMLAGKILAGDLSSTKHLKAVFASRGMDKEVLDRKSLPSAKDANEIVTEWINGLDAESERVLELQYKCREILTNNKTHFPLSEKQRKDKEFAEMNGNSGKRRANNDLDEYGNLSYGTGGLELARMTHLPFADYDAGLALETALGFIAVATTPGRHNVGNFFRSPAGRMLGWAGWGLVLSDMIAADANTGAFPLWPSAGYLDTFEANLPLKTELFTASSAMGPSEEKASFEPLKEKFKNMETLVGKLADTQAQMSTQYGMAGSSLNNMFSLAGKFLAEKSANGRQMTAEERSVYSALKLASDGRGPTITNPNPLQ